MERKGVVYGEESPTIVVSSAMYKGEKSIVCKILKCRKEERGARVI
jgi:hypothetical protein